MNKYYTNAIVVWISFLALLTFYILQKGQGLEGMEPLFFNTGNRGDQYVTSLWNNLASFGFVGICFLFIWYTKKEKICRWYSTEILENVFVIILLILWGAKAMYSLPSYYLSDYLPVGKMGKLILFTPLALLSIPCLLFVISWSHEQVASIRIKKIDNALQNVYFYRFCATLAIICVCVAVYYAFSLDCRSDEGVSLLFISHGYEDLIASTAVDVHPPLYYCITKCIVDCLLTCLPSLHVIYAAKLASVVPNAILVFICLTIVRREWGNYAGGLGALAVLCMPGILNHTQEIRMYSWAMLWMTCCWLWAYKIYRHNRFIDWIILAGCGILVTHTQYIVCIGVFVIYIFLAIWSLNSKCFNRWCILGIITIVACIPWGATVLYYHHHLPPTPVWMVHLDRMQICHLLLFPTKDIIIWGILGMITLISLRQLHNTREEVIGLIGLTLPVIFTVVAVVISNIIVPVISPRIRYFIPLLGCMWLGALFLVAKVTTKKFRILFTMLVIFVSASEMISFVQVRQKGRDSAQKIAYFLENKDAHIISCLSPYMNLSISTYANRPLYMLGEVGEKFLQRYINNGINVLSVDELGFRGVYYFICHYDDQMEKFREMISCSDLHIVKYPDYYMPEGDIIHVYHIQTKNSQPH